MPTNQGIVGLPQSAPEDSQRLFLEQLPAVARSLPHYTRHLAPSVIEISWSELADIVDISQQLSESTCRLVTSYTTQQSLQRLIPLRHTTMMELERLSSVPYCAGILRPDFIYTNEGKPQACEINARFPFNASLLSCYVQDALGHFTSAPLPLRVDAFRSYVKTQLQDPLLVIKDRERGYDVHFAMHNHRVEVIAPTQVTATHIRNAATIVLELHHDELELILPLIVDAMLDGKVVLNDPRSTLIAHDKRVLAYLTQGAPFADVNSSARHIAGSIVPSFVRDRSPEIFGEALEFPDGWVAKRAVSGKSQGVYFGSVVSRRDWEMLLLEFDIVLQPYVPQPVYQSYDMREKIWIASNLVATSVIADGECYGLGFFRLFSLPPLKHCAMVPGVISATEEHDA